jgi:hypothetical protein
MACGAVLDPGLMIRDLRSGAKSAATNRAGSIIEKEIT